MFFSLQQDHAIFTIKEHFKLPFPTVFVNNSLTKQNIQYILYTDQGQKCGSVIIVVRWCLQLFFYWHCLDINYMYHMTECNLLLVVCRSWNHNIDACFVYYKSVNVTYNLSTDTHGFASILLLSINIFHSIWLL